MARPPPHQPRQPPSTPPKEPYQQKATIPKPQSNTAADISMIFGVLGICGILPIIGGIIALISRFIGLFNNYKRGLAIAGFILGFVGSGLWIPLVILYFIPWLF